MELRIPIELEKIIQKNTLVYSEDDIDMIDVIVFFYWKTWKSQALVQGKIFCVQLFYILSVKFI